MVVVLTLDGNPKAPAQFIMREGSKIINCLAEPSNTTNGGGAAVNIGQQTAGNMDSAFIMEGGEISGNTAKYAIVHLFRGRFVMQGGKISNNYLQNEAVASGAVLINGGTFSLTNGEISDNTLRGVYISSAGMTIEGGKITRNGTGTINGSPITGAGIYDSSTTNANPSIIKGGEISGNGSPYSVGSALACNSNNFTLSGNPAIEGSILLKAYQIFLDKSFVNAHDNGEEGEYVFPLFLHGSWTENKAVLKPTGEETTVAISKFNLAGIYSGNDYDLTLGSLGSRYLKDDGTIGINPE
jgi:hypothetical protein